MRSRRQRIGVTGSPGTGKKTIAPLLGESLGVPVLDLNRVAVGGGGRIPGKTVAVYIPSLRRRVRERFTHGVVYGHLLPHVFRRGELESVVVLRCDPSILKRRLEARGYAKGKVRENVEAELIGVTLSESVERFGAAAVLERDTSHGTPERVVHGIVSEIRSPRRSRQVWIDWTIRYGSPRKLGSLLSTESTDSAET